MEVDVTQGLVGFNDEEIKQGEDALTLKDVITNALMGVFEDEKNLTGKKKLERHELARKVNKCEGTMKFSGADLDMVKELISKTYATLVCGAAWELLTEESKPVDLKLAKDVAEAVGVKDPLAGVKNDTVNRADAVPAPEGVGGS